MAPKGLFIALEGCEGAGKTTLAKALAVHCEAARREVVLTREPGGTPFGEAVRTLLRAEGIDPWAEAFLFLAARAQLVRDVIRPAVEAGRVVICDRFAASTFAYQGHGRGLDLTRLRVANTIATDALQPDLTILLDIDPAIGLKRKAGEEGVISVGREPLAFHERVRRGYLALASEAAPGTWVTFEADEPPAAIASAAWTVIWPRIRPRPLADGN